MEQGNNLEEETKKNKAPFPHAIAIIADEGEDLNDIIVVASLQRGNAPIIERRDSLFVIGSLGISLNEQSISFSTVE